MKRTQPVHVHLQVSYEGCSNLWRAVWLWAVFTTPRHVVDSGQVPEAPKCLLIHFPIFPHVVQT